MKNKGLSDPVKERERYWKLRDRKRSKQTKVINKRLHKTNVRKRPGKEKTKSETDRREKRGGVEIISYAEECEGERKRLSKLFSKR